MNLPEVKIDDLLEAAERDLLADIKHAQAIGLFEPTYEPVSDNLSA